MYLTLRSHSYRFVYCFYTFKQFYIAIDNYWRYEYCIIKHVKNTCLHLYFFILLCFESKVVMLQFILKVVEAGLSCKAAFCFLSPDCRCHHISVCWVRSWKTNASFSLSTSFLHTVYLSLQLIEIKDGQSVSLLWWGNRAHTLPDLCKMSELMVMSQASIPLTGELLSFGNGVPIWRSALCTGGYEERCIKFQSYERRRKKKDQYVIVWVNYDPVPTCLWLHTHNM